MKAYFVTGTDTDVGKTTVSMALLAAATRRGLQTRCMKPVESGCKRARDGSLTPADATRLAGVCSSKQSLMTTCPYRFQEPVAPGMAAEARGITIDLNRIEERYRSLAFDKPDFILVEGAGGLLVPLGGKRLIADMACKLGLPLLVVARPGLGTINHTLLTVQGARLRGLRVAGVIFSNQQKKLDKLTGPNAQEIALLGEVRYLGCLPKVDTRSVSAMADAAESSLDCDYLML